MREKKLVTSVRQERKLKYKIAAESSYLIYFLKSALGMEMFRKEACHKVEKQVGGTNLVYKVNCVTISENVAINWDFIISWLNDFSLWRTNVPLWY